MVAGLSGNTRVGELLIERGADPDKVNDFGETALSAGRAQRPCSVCPTNSDRGASLECHPHGHSLESWITVASGLSSEKLVTILEIVANHRQEKHRNAGDFGNSPTALTRNRLIRGVCRWPADPRRIQFFRVGAIPERDCDAHAHDDACDSADSASTGARIWAGAADRRLYAIERRPGNRAPILYMEFRRRTGLDAAADRDVPHLHQARQLRGHCYCDYGGRPFCVIVSRRSRDPARALAAPRDAEC